jgi:hypothetical protein
LELKFPHAYFFAGIIAVAGAVKDMGAISSFIFSGPHMDSGAVTIKTCMTKVDVSGEKLGVSGAMMLSAFLPKCT